MKVDTEEVVRVWMRRLGYKPWHEYELEKMHWNLERIQSQGFRQRDDLFRISGRSTRGLLEYVANNLMATRLMVVSPFGDQATHALARRLENLLEMLKIPSPNKVRQGRGGYIDHHVRMSDFSDLHLDAGVTHAWNKTQPTCLACLSIGSLPTMRA